LTDCRRRAGRLLSRFITGVETRVRSVRESRDRMSPTAKASETERGDAQALALEALLGE
jgi:hypothetical protein